MNEKKDSTIYRFSGLIHAIEFFSQRFDIEQILEYIFEFVNELLIVDKNVVFAEINGHYRPISVRGYIETDYSFEATKKYNDIVMFHAGLFSEDDLKKYFPNELLEKYPAKLGIPLVMDKSLYGFILINREGHREDFNVDDNIIANALMNLFYTALTNYKSYNELNDVKKELDEKIFNLFAINQSSKVLLSTLELKDIYDLAISVFSELTQSGITSLFIYDDVSSNYTLKANRNIFDISSKLDIVLYPKKRAVNYTKSIINMEDEAQRNNFLDNFYDGDKVIELLKPVFIVNIKKQDKVIGFVTLGEKVNNSGYNQGILELIESLAASLYISITNAKYIETISEQKNIINNKLKKLTMLNMLMKNINTSSNINELLNITKETMEVSFEVNCGFIACYDKDNSEFTICNSINCDLDNYSILYNDSFSELKKGRKIIKNCISEVEQIFDESILGKIEEKYSGALIIPIYLDRFEIELLGMICILDIKDTLLGNDESVITFETIANHIAPVWYQLIQIENTKKEYIPNYLEIFNQQLIKEVEEANTFDLEFFVYHIKDNKNLNINTTDEFKKILDNYKKAYLIDNQNIFIVSLIDEYNELISYINNDEIKVDVYKYKSDFNSVEEFYSLFD